MITNDSVMLTAVGAYLLFCRMGSNPMLMEIGIASGSPNTVSVLGKRGMRPVGISIDIPVGDRKVDDVMNEWKRICRQLALGQGYLEHEIVEVWEKSGAAKMRPVIARRALDVGYFTREEYEAFMKRIIKG